MSGRKYTLLFAFVLLTGQNASAQDLSIYDQNNYSGGYAEGAYSPVGDEQLYPFDSQDQWQHGYIQYMPFYGAYKHFRPYNYKHVGSQTQTAAGWGMSPRMPYSQQYWHRYHSHAKMSHPASGAYESYLHVEPPAKKKPEEGQQAPGTRPVPQRGPEPSDLNAPELPNSVYYAPQGRENFADASYRMQPAYTGEYLPASAQQPVYSQQTTPQPYAQPPILMVP